MTTEYTCAVRPVRRAMRSWSGYAAATKHAIVLALILAIGGCGQTSAGDGPRSYLSGGEDSIYHIAWDGNGDGTIQGSLRATRYVEDEYEVTGYEENVVGTAQGDVVTIESGGYGTLRGRVDGDTLTIEYESEDGLGERVYEDASLEEYEQAAAEFRARKEAQADADRAVEEAADGASDAASLVKSHLSTAGAPAYLKEVVSEAESQVQEDRQRVEEAREVAAMPQEQIEERKNDTGGFALCFEMPGAPSGESLIEVPAEEGFMNGLDLYGDLAELAEEARAELGDLDESLKANPDANDSEAQEARSYAEQQLAEAEEYMEETDRLLPEANEKTAAAKEESERLGREWDAVMDSKDCLHL